MRTIEELSVRFPKARLHFAPTPDCPRCGGSGVEWARTLRGGIRLNEGPCACLFFGPDTNLGVTLVAEATKRLAGTSLAILAVALFGCSVNYNKTPSGRTSYRGLLGTDVAMHVKAEGAPAIIAAQSFSKTPYPVPPDWHDDPPNAEQPKDLISGNGWNTDGAYFEMSVGEANYKAYGSTVFGVVSWGATKSLEAVSLAKEATTRFMTKEATTRFMTKEATRAAIAETNIKPTIAAIQAAP